MRGTYLGKVEGSLEALTGEEKTKVRAFSKPGGFHQLKSNLLC